MGNHVGNPRHAPSRRQRRVGQSPYARHEKAPYLYAHAATELRAYAKEHHCYPPHWHRETTQDVPAQFLTGDA